MIVDIDASGLEWRVACELSGDLVMRKEIEEGQDIHMANSKAFFGDELHRQDSKILAFRAIYGGTAYAFFMDNKMPDFTLPRWEEILDTFYKKYSALGAWQRNNFIKVCNQGFLQTFTGRIYNFEKTLQRDGSYQYNRPDVCNFPVQGTATADIIPLVMNMVFHKIYKQQLQKEILIINQVHDSIVFDIQPQHLDWLATTVISIFRTIPNYAKAYWGYDWKTPMDGECKYGDNWGNLTKYKLN